MHARLIQEIEKLPRVSGSATGADQVYITSRLRKLLDRAQSEAKRLHDEYVSVEHILLAAADEKIFKEIGLTRKRLMRTLQDIRGACAMFNMINRLIDSFWTALEPEEYNRRQANAVKGRTVEDIETYAGRFAATGEAEGAQRG